MDSTILKLINNLKDVPAMPNVVMQALNVVKDPNSGIKELSDVMGYDQSLSIKVLNLVNSAYYGFSQQISSITRALTILGMNKSKNIIVTVAMKPMFSSEVNKDLWEHSIKVAVGCECISSHLNIMNSDDAFMMGFMHDIGKIILNMQNKEIFHKIQALNEQGEDIIELEQKYYGTNHAQVGAVLANKWQLPILLINTIKYHHNPLIASAPTECSLVYLVDKLVQDNFDKDSLNMDYIKSLNFKIDKPEILRSCILDRAEVLINELSN